MRHAVMIGALVCMGSTAFIVSSAHAQTCHHVIVTEPARDPQRSRVQLGVGSEIGLYRTPRYEGTYQGINVHAQWHHRWVHLSAALPAYRIVRNGLTAHGLGDLMLDARVPVLRLRNNAFVAGLGFTTTAPTGKVSADLGMGHWMIMPGAWATWSAHRAFITTQLAYGRAITAHASEVHHRSEGISPIPNPMNAQEIEAAIAGGYTFFEMLRIRAGTYGAVPIALDHGAARMAGYVGVDLMVGRFQLSAEQHLPILGDPFRTKTIIAIGAFLY